jgi:hypothetical protein
MSDKKIKAWMCKNDHILGYIQWNGKDIPQLMVLREPIDITADRPDEVDLLGPLDGNMPVRCKVCDDVKIWKVSVSSLLALFMQLDDAEIFEFSQRLLELNRK